MFRSIVVPLDDSPLSNAAVPYAALLTDAPSRITLVSVIEPPHWRWLLDDDAQARAAQHLRTFFAFKLSERSRSLADRGKGVVQDIRSGDAATEILAAVDAYDADLIVIASRSRTGILRHRLGSVAARVLREAPVPTLVVHPPETGVPATVPDVRTIVVPLDGSPTAEAALPIANALARRLAVPIEVIRIVDDRPMTWEAYPFTELYAPNVWAQLLDRETERAREYVEATAARLRGEGTRASGRVLRGDPADELVDALSQRPNALVAMTSHGYSGVEHWLLGSVAERVVGTVHCPVFVGRSIPAVAHRSKETG